MKPKLLAFFTSVIVLGSVVGALRHGGSFAVARG